MELLIDKFQPEKVVAEAFVTDVNGLLCEFNDLPNPYFATLIHRKAKELFKCDDLYKQEKEHANGLLLNSYNALKTCIHKNSRPFNFAAKLAVAGNIIDYGAHSVKSDIEGQILALLKQPLVVDQSEELEKSIKSAKSILYLGDNAGEIVCDKLFIEYINHPNLIFATRGKAVINDVTYNDAMSVGIDKVCKVISNGFDAPSTLTQHCSDEFMEAYNSADLIISKGQGNFEGLMDEKDKTIFFMLMAKCKPIADMLGVAVGSLVITSNKK